MFILSPLPAGSSFASGAACNYDVLMYHFLSQTLSKFSLDLP